MLGCFLCSELPAPSIDLAPESTVMGMVKCVLERKERVRDRPVWRPQNLSFLPWNQKTGSEPMTNGRAAESGPKVPAGPEELSSPVSCRVGAAGTGGLPLKPPAFRS